jgi:hypothetical protein
LIAWVTGCSFVYSSLSSIGQWSIVVPRIRAGPDPFCVSTATDLLGSRPGEISRVGPLGLGLLRTTTIDREPPKLDGSELR